MPRVLPKKSKILNQAVTVDPGWNTGLALWMGNLIPAVQLIKEPPKNKKIKVEIERLNWMFKNFEMYLEIAKPNLVLLEGVELWSGSTRSMTSAARGNLFSLAYIVGGYIAVCRNLDIKVKLTYARGGKEKDTWKGQLTPLAIDKRIERVNGQKYPEHIREAVGIGLSYMGVL